MQRSEYANSLVWFYYKSDYWIETHWIFEFGTLLLATAFILALPLTELVRKASTRCHTYLDNTERIEVRNQDNKETESRYARDSRRIHPPCIGRSRAQCDGQCILFPNAEGIRVRAV